MVKLLYSTMKFSNEKYLNRTLIVIVFVCILVILFGCGFNDLGLKYSRALPHKDCDSELIILQIPDSQMCCDSALHHLDWICVAAYDSSNRLFTSHLAFIFPLVPLLATVVTDMIRQQKITRNLIIGGVLRLLLYITIFAFRTGILYFGANIIQNSLQGVLHYSPHDLHDCWYADWVTEQKCKDHFDFSDHIVMYIAHYLVPCAMELAVVATRAFSERGSVLSICLQYGVSLVACVLFLSVAIRAMFLSCMFFHTPLESMAGAALVVLLVVTPCFFLDGSTYWRAACVGPKLARLSL